MEPLGKEGRQVPTRHLFGHLAERVFIDVPELPSVVIGAQNPPHGLRADQGVEPMEEQLSPGIDHRIIGREVAILMTRIAHRLGAAVEIQAENPHFGGMIA